MAQLLNNAMLAKTWNSLASYLPFMGSFSQTKGAGAQT